jgi:hypothetical protein
MNEYMRYNSKFDHTLSWTFLNFNDIRTENVCISLKVFMINYSSKKYVRENTDNCTVILILVKT